MLNIWKWNSLVILKIPFQEINVFKGHPLSFLADRKNIFKILISILKIKNALYNSFNIGELTDLQQQEVFFTIHFDF